MRIATAGKRPSEELQEQLEAARRAGRRQAAPFAKKRPQGRGGRPGRRAGTAYGQQGRRPSPARVDEPHAAPAGACPDCGGVVDRTRVASQYQEDLPVVHPLVRRFDIEVGHCSQCGRRVQGRHPLQTSDALGAASVQLGPGVAGLAVHLHTELGVPLAKVARLLRSAFGLHATPGGLAHLLHRVARDAAPLYGLLCDQVRSSSLVVPDETGWRVGAVRHWLWVFTTPETTVYAICPGRSFHDATSVLGPDFDGCWCATGGWSIAATTARCTRPASRTCYGAARCRRDSTCGTAATPDTSASTDWRPPAVGSWRNSPGSSKSPRRSRTPNAPAAHLATEL